jgi:hypothetical protein
MLVEMKAPDTEWEEVTVVYGRNVTGAALASVVPTSSNAAEEPGVMRCTVIGLTSTTATISTKAIFAGDFNHPSIWPSGRSVSLSLGYTSQLLNGIVAYINPLLIQLGDVFDLAIGYQWITDQALWRQVRAFGVLARGASGHILQLRFTNDDTRTYVHTKLVWRNSGTTQLFSVRPVDGVWQEPSLGLYDGGLYLTDENGVEGLIDTNNAVEVELKPEIPSDASSNDNTVTLELQLNWSTI